MRTVLYLWMYLWMKICVTCTHTVCIELMQFQDVLNTVVNDLMPNRLCDYLKELSVKFTDFVTKCHVRILLVAMYCVVIS